MPPAGAPQFDELYVISDLHLGGSERFQIFNSGSELERLIDNLRVTSPKKRVALVINGDFVDFLAEDDAKYFDPDGANDKLDRIIKRDAFKPVFEALARFTGAKNRRLVLTLGNHDLELSLPWVRTRLLEILSGGKEEACGRITLAFDGAGFPCRVGDASVLCVHGNEVDVWNLADYERLRRFGVEVSHGRPIESWVPNAGTQLVIDIMNGVKRDYPFVDLLKPETEAAVPTLLALAPDQHVKLSSIGTTLWRRERDRVRHWTGFLGGSDEDDMPGRAAALADAFAPQRTNGIGLRPELFDRELYARMLLDDASENYHRGIDPMMLLGADELGSRLGVFSTISGLATSAFKVTAAGIKLAVGMEPSEVLRQALDGLFKDKSFDPTTEDDTYKQLDKEVGDFDFLVSGHTHLARALERKEKSGYYFNSGTWARLIKLEENVLRSPEEFRKVYETFGQKSMQALDAHENLVMRRLSVVAIREDGGRTVGELRRVADHGPPGAVWRETEATLVMPKGGL